MQGGEVTMIEGYLKEDELYELIMKKPQMLKRVAINFIKSYGTGRVIEAFKEVRENRDEIVIQSSQEKEMDARLERIHEQVNQLNRTLAEALA
jgi:hypothetical protein